MAFARLTFFSRMLSKASTDTDSISAARFASYRRSGSDALVRPAIPSRPSRSRVSALSRAGALDE
jgi:hypothetical protein